MYSKARTLVAEGPPGKCHVMSLRIENVRRTRILAADGDRPDDV